MSVEFSSLTPTVLLVVELILLLVTLYVVLSARREGAAREHFIQEMYRTARIISRADYFNNVKDAFQVASKEVFARVTGTKPQGGEREVVEEVLASVEALSRKGVSVRFLLPKAHLRIYMGYRYVKAGASVKHHPGLIVGDMRYMVVDSKLVVLGLSEKTGEQEPTRSGYRIHSEGFAGMLKENFSKYWESEDAVDYESYAKEVLNGIRKQDPNISSELISTQLGLDTEEVVRLLRTIV